MSEMLRGYSRNPRPIRRTYSSQHEVDIHEAYPGEWKDEAEGGGVRFKMKDFYDIFDPKDEYRPSRRYNPDHGRGSNEMIDLRKAKRDLPSAGQIIWDDIGDSEVVDSLSWSQSDVEREIESWDQRLRENELKCQRTIAWDDGDMIQFDEPREVYLPRRTSSLSYHETRGRSPRSGRKRREVDRDSSLLRRYNVQNKMESSSLPQRHHYAARDHREEEDVKRCRREETTEESNRSNIFDAVGAMEIVPAPLEEDVRYSQGQSTEPDCRCPCDHTYSSYKQEESALFPPDVTRQEVTFYHQQTSTPSSISPTSGVYYLSSKHWLGIILIVLVGGAVGVALPYALRVQEGTTFDDRLALATSLLKQVPLIDGHNDLPWNIRKFLHNRLKDFKFREDLRQIKPWSKSAWSHTDLPRLRAGHVSAQFWAAYVPCEAQYKDAVQLTFEQVDVIRRFTERYYPDLTLCTTSEDIIAAHSRGQLCSLIGVEGGHSVGSSLPVLRALYEVGVRYLTLTSTCNTPWADCSLMDAPGQKGKPSGLTNFGKTIVKEMNRLGMVVDLSHVSEATMIGALNISKAPVIFSHSAAHALCNSTRNVPDRVLKQLAENGGVIMVNFYSQFLSCRDTATVQDAVAHIEHVRSVAGAEHVGLGAGYDGINLTPEGLSDVSSYPVLFAELLAAGWSEDHLKRLAGLNFLRVLKRVEQVRDELKEAGTSPSEDVIAPRLLAPHSNCTSKDLF